MYQGDNTQPSFSSDSSTGVDAVGCAPPGGILMKTITPQKRMYGNVCSGIDVGAASFSTPGSNVQQFGPGAGTGSNGVNLLSAISTNRGLSTRVTPQRGIPYIKH